MWPGSPARKMRRRLCPSRSQAPTRRRWKKTTPVWVRYQQPKWSPAILFFWQHKVSFCVFFISPSPSPSLSPKIPDQGQILLPICPTPHPARALGPCLCPLWKWPVWPNLALANNLRLRATTWGGGLEGRSDDGMANGQCEALKKSQIITQSVFFWILSFKTIPKQSIIKKSKYNPRNLTPPLVNNTLRPGQTQRDFFPLNGS